MAVRIPWDKYETAILIDACIKVQNNILSKEIAVSEVSADLRRLAISRGYEIDDIFRNENGISMQMTIMSALLQNKPSGLHNASKLFSDIRDIYINDHNAYTQIIAEAKAMINGKEDAKTLFIKYIKEKASKKADDIVFAIDKISEFAIATKVLNVSIYNNLTPEALNLLRKRVVTNKFFVVKNKKIMNNVQQAMILLNDYILSNSTTDNTEDVLLETQSTEAASTDKATSEFIIDFNDILSLAFTKPLKFKYKEITTINISSWTDLYIKIMREFIDEFPSRLLPGINFFSGERVDLGTSYHLNSMRAPKQMTDTLYLETNLSATDIVKKIKSVMDLCDVDYKDLTIYYVKKESDTNMSSSPRAVATPRRYDNTLEKDEFYTYLVEEAGVSESTGRSYTSQINSCETYAQEHSIGTGKLYTADTRTEDPLILKLEQIVLRADMDGKSYDDLKDTLQITMVLTKRLVLQSTKIVDIRGVLIHEEAFVDWEDGADALEGIVEKLMQKNNGYISSTQLFEYARIEMNMFLNDNDMHDERAVYDMAQHLFEKVHYHKKTYTFRGKMHISRADAGIGSNMDVYKKYAADQGGVFSFSGLVEYLESVGVSVGNLRNQMRMLTEPIFFFYDSNVVATAEALHIDDTWKKSIAESIKILFDDVGDHMILRNIPSIWFDRLPNMSGNRPWTPLLLQSVLRFYGKEIGARTIQALEGQSLETVHTMLAANDSPIQNFGDVVISCLLEQNVDRRKFEAEELRELLVDGGVLHGNELIWNMPKALKGDERFAWDISGNQVTVKI